MTDFQTALHQAAARQDHSQFCALIQHAVHGIDRLCTTQLQQVLHHPDFCALEARWRSLRHLTTLVTSPGGWLSACWISPGRCWPGS